MHLFQLLTITLQVGAGPAGLVLAISLLQNGVPVRVIEKQWTPRLGQRGAGIMVRLPDPQLSLPLC